MTGMTVHSPGRRRLVTGLASLGAALVAAPAHAQTARAAAGRNLALVQIIDSSPQQQDVTRDYLIGARAAWQAWNAAGGARGHSVSHQVVETDGSPAAIQATMDAARDNPEVLALFGSAGDALAAQVVTRAARGDIAHLAPWLHQPLPEGDDRSFALFASREQQVAHAGGRSD